MPLIIELYWTSWKPIGISTEDVKVFDITVRPVVKYSNLSKIRWKFTSLLKQILSIDIKFCFTTKKTLFYEYKKIMDIYLIYELDDLPLNPSNNCTIKKYLFGKLKGDTQL